MTLSFEDTLIRLEELQKSGLPGPYDQIIATVMNASDTRELPMLTTLMMIFDDHLTQRMRSEAEGILATPAEKISAVSAVRIALEQKAEQAKENMLAAHTSGYLNISQYMTGMMDAFRSAARLVASIDTKESDHEP